MIKTYAQVDMSGNVTCVCQCEEGSISGGDVLFLEPPAEVSDIELMDSYKWANGWVYIGARPSKFHKWENGWQLDTAAAWRHVRSQRQVLLGSTDWTQLPDVPPDIRTAYIAYRQALRDVTTQPDPLAIIWPTPPAV